MTTKKKLQKQIDPIPEFKNYREEAAFWETHDLADYWGQFKPATVQFAKNLSQGMTIRFDLETATRLRSEAAKKGIGPTTLVRMWVIERLRKQERRNPSSPATRNETARTRKAG